VWVGKTWLTCKGTIGDAAKDIERKHQPGLGVCEGLNHLLHLESLVLDSGLVGSQSLDSDCLFTFRDEVRARQVIRKEDPQYHGPHEGYGTQDDQVPSPLAPTSNGANTRDVRIWVADSTWDLILLTHSQSDPRRTQRGLYTLNQNEEIAHCGKTSAFCYYETWKVGFRTGVYTT
jgi:hypothetical protein